MKTTAQLERLMAPASLRSAWLMSRAWSPTWLSPISPSISALGTSAATESMTIDVDRAGPHEDLADLERLLAGVGLGDEQILDVDAELLGVVDVERMLGIDVGGDAAGLLHVGREVEGERGLAGRLRSVDLGDAAAGNPADAGGGVEVDGAGGDGGHLDPGRVGCPCA